MKTAICADGHRWQTIRSVRGSFSQPEGMLYGGTAYPLIAVAEKGTDILQFKGSGAGCLSDGNWSGIPLESCPVAGERHG